MSSTRAHLRERISRKVGGFKNGLVDLPPSTSEANAQRVIISRELDHNAMPPNFHSYSYAWVGRYNEDRQVLLSSFLDLNVALFTPPSTGSYTLTFWGYAAVGPFTPTGVMATDRTTLENAIIAVAGLESVTVTIAGAAFKLSLTSSDMTVQSDNGTMITGFGQVSLSAPWRNALPAGTPWELSAKLPFTDNGVNSGLNWIVNEALGYVSTIAQVPYTTTGLKKIVPITEAWFRNSNQLHAIWRPYRRALVATFTPPVSGTYNLTFALGLEGDVVVSGLAYGASNATIEAAVTSALSETSHGIGCEVTGTTIRTIRLTDVYYGSATLTASAGTVGSVELEQLEPRYRYDGYKLVLNRQKRHLELDQPFLDGHTFELEMSCRAKHWVCPQVDWETLGTTWVTSDDGLTYDLDQADVDEEAITLIGAWLACEELSRRDVDNEKTWKRESRSYAELAAQYLTWQGDQPTFEQSRDPWTFDGFVKGTTGLIG